MDSLLATIREDLGSEVELLAEQPRRHSRVLRVAAGGERLFVKQVKLKRGDDATRERTARRVRNEFDILRRIHGSMQLDEGLFCIRPVACYPDQLALVMEEARGQTLNAELRRHARWWPGERELARLRETLRRVGLWMRRFQELTREGDASPRMLETLELEIAAFLSTLVDRPRAAFPRELARSIREYVARAIDGARDAPLPATGATGEISPENMLIDDGRVAYVDFGMYSLRTAFSDPAMMYQHLSTLRLQPPYRPHVVTALKAAFLEGYGRPDLYLDPLFRAYRIKYRLSRIDAESGRKWAGYDPARKLYFRRSWRRSRRELALLTGADG
jgi:tRNA A-37 threonylcarbamoyl transferase component Bud32